MAWWRGRKKKAQAKPTGPASALDELKDALKELGEGAGDRRRARPRAHRADGYREVVLRGGKGAPLSDALMALNQEAYERSQRLPPEERRSVELPGGPPGATREQVTRKAEEAAEEMGEEMRRLGIPEPTHYYSAVERRETGEVDRTYHIGQRADKGDKPKKRRGKRRG